MANSIQDSFKTTIKLWVVLMDRGILTVPREPDRSERSLELSPR